MKEEWLKIIENDKYEISNLGNIRLEKTKELIKTVMKEPCGYV